MNQMEQKLVEALESGKYTQGHYQLHRADTFCCLGVACDISGLDKWTNHNEYLNKICTLPLKVMKKFNWSHGSGRLSFLDRFNNNVTLASLNDNGFTFSQIADVIKAGLVEKTKNEV